MILDRFRLDGKTAIVTGAGRGIGAGCAVAFAEMGADVVCAARTQEQLDETAGQVRRLGRRAVTVRCDVNERDQLEEVVARAMGEFGRIDVLVNNAGAGTDMPAIDLPVDDFRRVIEVNLVAPFALAQAAAGAMLDQGSGSIVNIASQFGLVGTSAGLSAYSAAKGGLVNLTRHLAAEWSPKGVRVNALAPGYFATEMTRDVFEDERFVAWTTRNTPLRRTGREGELDGALLYLASDASSYTTGSVLVVDGGWTAI
jgi:NAD(P)-dependent dehydrogenase (short-subunit alcohol dehydrogenase family)